MYYLNMFEILDNHWIQFDEYYVIYALSKSRCRKFVLM